MGLNSKNRSSVLLICCSHAWGGLEKKVLEEALALQEYHRPVQILLLEGSPLHGAAQEQKIKCVPLSFVPWNWFDFRLISLLKKKINEGIQNFHLHQPSLLGSVVPALRRSSVQLIVTRHIRSHHQKKTILHRWIYQRVNALIVLSEDMKQNVLATHPIASDRVKVVPPFLTEDRFLKDLHSAPLWRSEWSNSGEFELVVGVVGRLDPAKGQMECLKALLLLRAEGVTCVRFVFVGEETRGVQTRYLDALRQFSSDHGVTDSVLFAGYISDMPAALFSLDVLLLPSRDEAFGLVAIEALAAGRMVIMTKNGSACEITDQGRLGLLMESPTPENIKEAVFKILELKNKQEWSTIAESASSWAKKNYALPRWIHTMNGVYDLREKALSL